MVKIQGLMGTACKVITLETKERFQEDGAVVLRSVFSDYWIKLVQQGIQKNLENPSKYAEWLKVSLHPLSTSTVIF